MGEVLDQIIVTCFFLPNKEYLFNIFYVWIVWMSFHADIGTM